MLCTVSCISTCVNVTAPGIVGDGDGGGDGGGKSGCGKGGGGEGDGGCSEADGGGGRGEGGGGDGNGGGEGDIGVHSPQVMAQTCWTWLQGQTIVQISQAGNWS